VLFLVPSFLTLVQPLSEAMSPWSFRSFLTILTGWIFTTRRTITGMLVVAGVAGQRHHAAFHRLFAAAKWSLDQLGLLIFGLLQALLPDGTVELTLDDTLARKRGLKVFGAGMHHDPLLSTRKTAVTNWGHSWVVLAVVVRLPFCAERVFSLPILFRLYLNHKAAHRWNKAHRTRPELGLDLVRVLCRAHPQRRFHLLTDSTYGGESVLGHLPENCDMTSRLPLNARLYDALPERKPGTNGRPRKRGARLPTPEQMLRQRARRVSPAIYARKDRVRLVETVAHWHGIPHRPLKVVVIEPLTGGRKVQAFYSTRVDSPAEEVLASYARRWSIEETFQGGKSHLGFEEPQGWTRKAVSRTAPIALLLYSLVVLWFAREGHPLYRPPTRPWYRKKTRPSFADMLLTLRRESLHAQVSKELPNGHLPQNLLNALFSAAQVPT
jgi:hypothetical protein